MADIEVTIPGERRRYLPRERPIMTLRALRDYGRKTDVPDSVNYTHTATKLLDVNQKTGEVTFSRMLLEKENNDVTSLAMSVAAWDKLGNEAQTTVRITLDPSSSQDCNLLTKELCYWKSVSYRLFENKRATVIGSLSSPYLAEMCPEHSVKYALLNGTKYMSINRSKTNLKQWNLKSLKPFERDIIRHHTTRPFIQFGVGARVYFGVKCTVSDPSGTERDIEESLYITVLDENDNAPVAQSDETVIDVKLKPEIPLMAQISHLSRLMFIDRDSMQVNNYTFNILGDTANIFGLNCTIFEDDREGEPQTAIRCKLWLRRYIDFPVPIYRIILQINDTSLLPGNGDSTVNVTINFHKNSTESPLTPPPANLRMLILYPSDVNILRYSAPFARVTQPSTKDPKLQRFQIKHDSSAGGKLTGAFNVTVEGGIVYVQDIAVLRKTTSRVTLEVQWEDLNKGEMVSDVFTVHVAMEGSPTCTGLGVSLTDWLHCAEFTTPKSCTDACGLGTGGSASIENNRIGGHTRCVWRGDKKPGNNHTPLYSTCTPDAKTCPDHICDPLEELHYLICPQDCSETILLTATRGHSGRGIKTGTGVCKCDHFSTCTCGHQLMAPGASKKKTITATTVTVAETSTSPTTTMLVMERGMESNASAHRAIDILKEVGPCGTPCLIGIAGGILFLLGAITAVVACWRMGHGGKNGRRGKKYKESVNSLQSDYIDRTLHVPPETMHLNFDMNRSITTNITLPKVMPVDPKWEFPREKLHIEQTLGEGEFGRVLRAKALEISGMPGYTTVAVKTLKEDAREPELADLMSEYQLLKEVSHPNVIKLLGASTLPGGPVYLIIEFAEHGSLRNYLRRSRHLESEGRTPCSGAMLGALDFEPPRQAVCKISPRDILSFAWQISKGMSYLSDMKLVHRDLAARNVLLAEGMVCKVSDFGLTRDVYEDDNYLKRTKGRVPVKWMALESLSDHIYNSKSDVWSFGILLWELVTLGASPYPGVAVQNLFHLLKSGYRMERPDNCSPTLYKMIRCCWHNEPCARPTFRTLTAKLEAMLADGVDYLDLTPKVVHNRTYFTTIPDTLTPDDNDDTVGYGNLFFTNQEDINLQSGPQTIPKCAEADKLQVLWKRPESPKPSNGRPYVNEEKAQEMHHYESPIKLRPISEDTSSNGRPQSYLDMAGVPDSDSQLLLEKENRNGDIKISKITSL